MLQTNVPSHKSQEMEKQTRMVPATKKNLQHTKAFFSNTEPHTCHKKNPKLFENIKQRAYRKRKN